MTTRLPEHWHVVPPEVTIERIRRGIEAIGLKEEIVSYQPVNGIWCSRIAVIGLKAFANGKGTSKEASEASAYAELVERLSSGMDTGINIGPYRQLFGEKGDLLSKVTMFKYVDGYRWAHQDSIDNALKVEELLRKINISNEDADRLKMDSYLLRHWIPAVSLMYGNKKHVPILFVKWISATNGLAAGNTFDEAVVHSICEIFERYCLIHALRTMNNTKYPTIDIPSIKNKKLLSIVSAFESAGVEVLIKDIGMGVFPVYAVITFNDNIEKDKSNYNYIKAGSSFSSVTAIERCFTERMQGTDLSVEIEKSSDVVHSELDYLPTFFGNGCNIDLSPLRNGPVVELHESVVDGIEEELNIAKRILSVVGSDAIIVDHTHPIINFPVVRTIIPGLSDFMDWWKSTNDVDFIGNIDYVEDRYEDLLVRVLKSFIPINRSTSDVLKDRSRRDK